MTISIITSVFNNAATIRDSIESVLRQTYTKIEYIVIDGGSTDGTVEIIQEYKDSISQFISEPDKGIYDGLNKGIRLASGEIIAFLHSDDIYPNDSVVSDIMTHFNENLDGIYGDLVYTAKNNTTQILRYWKSEPFQPKLLRCGWMPPHPTLFLRRSVYENYGSFDLNFAIAADYDFMLRILTENITIKYIPKILYIMRMGGASNKSITNILLKSSEDLKALKKNKIGGIGTLVLKNLSKIKQFSKKNREY